MGLAFRIILEQNPHLRQAEKAVIDAELIVAGVVRNWDDFSNAMTAVTQRLNNQINVNIMSHWFHASSLQ
jgi:hypothetical protein